MDKFSTIKNYYNGEEFMGVSIFDNAIIGIYYDPYGDKINRLVYSKRKCVEILKKEYLQLKTDKEALDYLNEHNQNVGKLTPIFVDDLCFKSYV